jgi:hypothetical protein
MKKERLIKNRELRSIVWDSINNSFENHIRSFIRNDILNSVGYSIRWNFWNFSESFVWFVIEDNLKRSVLIKVNSRIQTLNENNGF